MKKYAVLFVIAVLAIGTASAQGWGWAPPETVRVEGTLQLQNGQIALSTGTAVYFVPDLARYIGFIDGLREGARISAEGFASGGFLQPTKLTIDGRVYDFATNTPGCCHMGQGHHRGYRGRGRWYKELKYGKQKTFKELFELCPCIGIWPGFSWLRRSIVQ